ncbi:leucine-rich repeat-containing protein 56 [Orycteropus afer afer]|uniref:Leucine-rich repeat-containing protein 56 n=1 Tax=Orycteropus afer afer TaxID=1230840 RepID=A0A8B7AHS8_ORYAF|nr:leucine-rich repeat-containing protein 56 [Orycteropus afer afer]
MARRLTQLSCRCCMGLHAACMPECVTTVGLPEDWTEMEPRPSTARIRVQELSWPGLHNPCPQSKGAGSQGGSRDEQLLGEDLSPAQLQALAQVDDLRMVSMLEMCVDTRKNSLGNFGIHLPNLSQLKLNGSCLASVRDLGTSLGHLQVLWLACCGLPDLDGISSFPALKELYVSYNNVSDLSPLCLLEQLEVLDLEGNSVEDLGQVHYLRLCPRLATLTLEGNPVCLQPGPGPSNKAPQGYNYRAEVRKLIPQLQVLDEAPATQTGLPAAGTLIQDRLLVQQAIREGSVLDGPLPGLDRPQGAPMWRLGPMLSLPKAQTRPPRPWPLSLLLPGGPLPEGLLPEDPAPADDASNLTHGTSHVLCGNPTKGLRERKHQCQAWVPAPLEKLPSQRAATGPDPTDCPDLLALTKLRTWRELCLRHQESPKDTTAAPQGPPRGPEAQDDRAGSQAAPGPPSPDPELSRALGCKLIPSPPKYPMPPDSGPSPWGPTEQHFRGRRLRGLGQGVAAVTVLRALDVASDQGPRAQGHSAPQRVSDAATGPQGLQCMLAPDPITLTHAHP